MGERESPLHLGFPNVPALLLAQRSQAIFLGLLREYEVDLGLGSSIPTPSPVLCSAVTCCVILNNWIVFPVYEMFIWSFATGQLVGMMPVFWDIKWTDFLQVSGCGPNQQRCYIPVEPVTITQGSHKC